MRLKGLTLSIVAIAVLAILLSLWAQKDPLEVSLLVGFLLAIWTAGAAIFSRGLTQASRRTRILIIVSVITALTVMTTHWPLRVAFAATKSAFEREAALIEGGVIPQVPIRIGPFIVREAGAIVQDSVYLWTATNPIGSVGFVKCPDESLSSNLNVWFTIQLGKEWHFVVED